MTPASSLELIAQIERFLGGAAQLSGEERKLLLGPLEGMARFCSPKSPRSRLYRALAAAMEDPK